MNLTQTAQQITAATVQMSVEGVSKRFGGVTAVDGVSVDVPKGRILSIIGPNGAGKTSLLNMISGFYKPDTGRITLEGRDITRQRPSAVAALGIARTFQNIALFSGLTVLDNLMLGRHVRMRSGVLSQRALLGPGPARGDPPPRSLRGDHRVPEAAGSAQAADRGAGLRPAQARRAGAGAGAGAQGAAARRADGRHEPGREGGHGALRARREPGARRDGRADRARHGRGDGHLRPRGGARSRPQDRRRHRRRRCRAIRR